MFGGRAACPSPPPPPNARHLYSSWHKRALRSRALGRTTRVEGDEAGLFEGGNGLETWQSFVHVTIAAHPGEARGKCVSTCWGRDAVGDHS